MLQDPPWVADQGDGTYRNPVLHADYSDPDVTRVGDDYYLTASSFTNVPGLPVLHSRDLVNWRIIGHALKNVVPVLHFLTARRGGGVWAPAIRHHAGKFMIYYPDPDFGIYVVTADNPAHEWSDPILIDQTRGAIDPAPFWDDDGNAYLIMGFAQSRAGFSNILRLKRLTPDGLHVIDEGEIVVDGTKLPPAETSRGPLPWTTIEGPKLYRHNGYYYIFAPAGGVKPGWQGVFRSRNLWGPYEAHCVMDQGTSDINGPHQGAWVQTQTGEDWFIHFQDKDSYGRVVHLQPMHWKHDWPVIGEDPEDCGRGQPVARHRKPDVGQTYPIEVPQTSDRFENGANPAWQWQANPQADWADFTTHPGWLRLKSVSASANLYETGNLFSQKFPAPDFSVTTRMQFLPETVGEQAGLAVQGYDYAWIGLEKTESGLCLVQKTRINAKDNLPEKTVIRHPPVQNTIYLRFQAKSVTRVNTESTTISTRWPAERRARHAEIRFFYSLDGEHFTPFGESFESTPGRWVGTQFGLFCLAPTGTPAHVATSAGYAEFAWVRVER